MAGTIGRRTFVKASLAAGISIVVRPLAAIGTDRGAGRRGGRATRGSERPTTAARRIDGWQKVTGAKVYAADFRAADMPGWPRDTAHAMLIKTPDATHVFEGIDLAMLDQELAPDRVVLAADLAAAAITVPPFYAGDLLCPAGKTPLYLGQPLALLIWNDFARFALARQAIKASSGVIRFGAKTGPVAAPPYAAARFVRVAGPDARSRRRLFGDARRLGPFRSSIRRTTARPGRCRRPAAPMRSARPSTATRSAARSTRRPGSLRSRSDVPHAVDRPGVPGAGGRPCLVRQRQAQARARYRRPVAARGRRQRRHARCQECGRAGGQGRSSTHCAEVGGAFGGKDHTIYPLYVALAGLFSPGRPVRLANDRYDQFQFGIKRHALDRAQPHGGGPRERPDHGVRVGPGSRRRRPRQSLRRRRVRRRHRLDRDL